MSNYDLSIPESLKRTQQWFGQIIGRPVDANSQMNPISPSGRSMTEEALDYITSGPVLRADQRIEIYNQQYWWRLLNALHENLPLTTRLFGYQDFNESLAKPYLVKYPPQHWSLNFLADRFPQWIQEEYYASDRELILHVAEIDWAFNVCFVAPQFPIDGQAEKLQTQPYVQFFRLPYDLFQFRKEFLLQTPEYWEENEFPSLHHFEADSPGHFVLYRNSYNNIVHEKIEASEFTVLEYVRKGISLDDLCAWLETLPPESLLYKDSNIHLGEWFQRWTASGWLQQS